MRRLICGFIVAAAWCGVVYGQAAAGAPAFDVASVKPSPPFQPGPGRATFVGGPRTDPGRATWTNVPLRFYVMQAYGFSIAWRIEGGPAWFASDNFDIVATFPTDTPREQIPLMLKTLLADRFKLVTHVETKEHAIYALVVGKNGQKIRESAADTTGERDTIGVGHLELHKVTLQQLTELLSPRTLDGDERPVVDMTGLKGLYDIALDWAPEDAAADGAQSGEPSLFTAVSEQLGLKLEAQKASVEILVIDHAEKPSEN